MNFLFRRKRRRPASVPANSGTPDHEGRTPAQVVVAYVDAMHDWELRAFKSSRGGDISEEVRADLRAVREAYLTPRALSTNTGVSYGNAPAFDTDGMTVLGVEERDRSHARVTTGEFPFDTARHGLDAQEHEYRLVLVDGRWRLNSRTTKDWDGHIIRGLL